MLLEEARGHGLSRGEEGQEPGMRAVVGLEAGREGEEPLCGEVRLPCLGRMSLEGRRPLTRGGRGHERPVKQGHLLVGEPLVASQRRDRPAAAASSAL